MSGIGGINQVFVRLAVMSIAIPAVLLYTYFLFPSRADCRAGSEEACAVHAIFANPVSALMPDRPAVIEWVGGHQHRVDPATFRSIFDLGYPVLVRQLLAIGIILFSGILAYTLAPTLYMRYSRRKKHHKRGAKVVSWRKLRALCRRKAGGLTVGGVPIPRDLEPLSFRFAGSPGSGKSQAITRMIGEFRRRGNPAVVADASGEFLSRNWREGDVILNPFDARSVGWSPFAELSHAGDIARLALAFVPETEGEAETWSGYSRTLLEAVLQRLLASKVATNRALYHYCCIAQDGEVAALIQGTPAARFFSKSNERMLASIRSILSSQIAPIQYLDLDSGADGFSITDWVRDSQNAALWLPYREDSRRAVLPLLGAWLELATTSLMTQKPAPGRRVFIVLDELSALGKITSLSTALAQGRKFGLVCLAGYQSSSQLVATYGRETSKTLLACLQNRLVLSTSDFESADLLSKDLGQAEVSREEHTMSGRAGEMANHSRREHRAIESTILASEIQSLPPLHGLLRLAGDYPIARVEIPVFNAPEVALGFVPAPPRPAPSAPQIPENQGFDDPFAGDLSHPIDISDLEEYDADQLLGGER